MFCSQIHLRKKCFYCAQISPSCSRNHQATGVGTDPDTSQSAQLFHSSLSGFCPKEPDIPVKTPEEAEEENRREYDEFLVLEENILKSAGLLPASAGTQDP